MCLCLYEPGAPDLDVAKRNSGSTDCRIWSDGTEPVLVSAFGVSPLTLSYFGDPPVVLGSSGGILDEQHCSMPSRVLIELFSAFMHKLWEGGVVSHLDLLPIHFILTSNYALLFFFFRAVHPSEGKRSYFLSPFPALYTYSWDCLCFSWSPPTFVLLFSCNCPKWNFLGLVSVQG